MMKHKLLFQYEMAPENDEWSNLKEVNIRCNSLDPEDILDAFTEFCACMNVQMQGAIVDEEEPGLH